MALEVVEVHLWTRQAPEEAAERYLSRLSEEARRGQVVTPYSCPSGCGAVVIQREGEAPAFMIHSASCAEGDR